MSEVDVLTHAINVRSNAINVRASANPVLRPPDEAVARSELLEQIQKTANRWPKPEREAFELYFVEGFEPDEIGMVLGLSTKQANELLDNIRSRLREALLAEAAAEQP